MIFEIFLLPALCLSTYSNHKSKSFKFDKNNTSKHLKRKVAHNGYSDLPYENNDSEMEFNAVAIIFTSIVFFVFIVFFIFCIYKVCCRKKNKDKNVVSNSTLINQNNDSYHDAIPPTIPQQPYQQYNVYNQDIYQQPYPQIYSQQYTQPQQPYIQYNMMPYQQPYEQSYQSYNPQYISQNILNNSA